MRVWCVKLLLAFFLIAASARGTVHVKPCGDDFGDIGRADAVAIKRANLHFKTGADNGKFIDAVTGDEADRYGLFFHIDNAILKNLNDHYFRDQELSASVESLFTKIFIKQLQADGALKPNLFYSDYKTIRLGFTRDTPQTRRRLEKVYEKAAAEFKATLAADYPGLARLHSDPGKRADDAANWHLGGFGRTADEAATASRLARDTFTPGELTPIHDFKDPKHYEELSKRVRHTEQLRQRVVGEAAHFGDKAGILAPGVGGQKILSREAIEILRKIPGPTDAEDVAYLAKRFHSRFGIDLLSRPGLAEAMLAYYRAADVFSPAIFEKHEISDLGVGKTKAGSVRVDIAGQNARNLNELMGALAQATFECPGGCLGERAVQLARIGQTRASLNFERRRRLFRDAVKSAGLAGDESVWKDGVQFSGDDGIFMPAKDLTAAEKQRLMREVAKHGASDFRVTFVPHQFVEGGEIPSRDRALYVGQGENLEKALRLHLEALGFGRAELKKLAIGVDLIPSAHGPSQVDLVLGGVLDAAQLGKVRRALDHVMPPHLKVGIVTAP